MSQLYKNYFSINFFKKRLYILFSKERCLFYQKKVLYQEFLDLIFLDQKALKFLIIPY